VPDNSIAVQCGQHNITVTYIFDDFTGSAKNEVYFEEIYFFVNFGVRRK